MFHVRHATTAFAGHEFNTTAPRRPRRRPCPRPHRPTHPHPHPLPSCYAQPPHRHERPSKLVRCSVPGFHVGRRQRGGRGDVPNATCLRSFFRSLTTISRLAPPMPRRSRKTLILCKWVLCGWLDVEDECDRVRGSARGSMFGSSNVSGQDFAGRGY